MTQAFAARELRRFTPAVGLCLLAFLFALEAKIAWYSPPTGPLSAIQSAKARPADAPDVVPHRVASYPSVPAQVMLLLFAVSPVAKMMKAESFFGSTLALPPRPISAAAFFSPGLFFRPPPSR